MKRTITIATIAALLLCACAEVQQGDENRVSIVGGDYTSRGTISLAAQKHCAKYGKTAVLQIRYTVDTTIFRCQ